MGDAVKLRVHVGGRPVGWVRQVKVDGNGHEVFMVASSAKATRYDDQISMGAAMLDFVGPERETSNGRDPVVTFQLVRV